MSSVKSTFTSRTRLLIHIGRAPQGIGVCDRTFVNHLLVLGPLGIFGSMKIQRSVLAVRMSHRLLDWPKKPKKDLKFDPASNPGIFVIHPGFLWRGDYLVASLKELNETDFDDLVKLHRVFKITRPEGNFVFPLQDRCKALREGKVSSVQSGPTVRDAPLLEAGQDPQAVADVGDDTLLDEPAPSKVKTIIPVDHKTGRSVEIRKMVPRSRRREAF